MVPTRVLIGSVVILLSIVFYPSGITAHHSWGKYHWARASNPLQLNVGDNLTGSSGWGTYLNNAIGDWNTPTRARMVNLNGVAGQSSSPDCAPRLGRIEVCNGSYGTNGWLGIAQIWTSSGFHIAQAITKVNDTYFNMAQYNTSAWRQLVMCQEVAHDFGLDHQDENFNNTNLGTCMDYTSDPDGTLANPDQLNNEHPNDHDFEQLVTIYSHLDGSGGGGGGGNGRGRQGGFGHIFPIMPDQAFEHRPDNNQSSWGRMVSNNGRVARFVLDLGNGHLIHTFVIWA